METKDSRQPENYEKYEKPRITDHGNLADLTAGHVNGGITDATIPVHHAPTFVSGP